MNFSLFSLLVCLLAYFASIGLSADPPVHHVHRPQNPQLAHLLNVANVLQNNFTKIVHNFELAITFHNAATQLSNVKSLLRTAEYNANVLLVDVNSEIQDMGQNVFLDRIWLNIVRLEAESYLRGYKKIRLEIVGSEQGVSQFGRYAHSDTISVYHQLAGDRSISTWKSLIETNDLLMDAYYHNQNSTVYSHTTKQSFVAHFGEIQRKITGIRDQLTSEYYREVDRIRLNGQEVALTQQAQIELEIDSYNFILQFVRQYEELFFKLN